MVILKLVSAVTLSSHKENFSKEDKKKYPFLTRKGLELIKHYTVPRTDIGLCRYASYKDYGESIWRIGYGSKKIQGRWLSATDKATIKEINAQLLEDLKEFSNLVRCYVLIPLNANRKSAVLSFAHSIGISSFKTCRLLELLNSSASKSEIIKEWSPFINRLWQSGGSLMVDRRRTELNTFYAADKEFPTFIPHRCRTQKCLLNLVETYTGAPNQMKAIEYLEKKLLIWDPSGSSLKRFFRYWSEKPTGLGSLPR